MNYEESRLALKKQVVCPHCNLYTANDKICTNLGCGKRLAAPVQLFARPRRTAASISKNGKVLVSTAKLGMRTGKLRLKASKLRVRSSKLRVTSAKVRRAR